MRPSRRCRRGGWHPPRISQTSSVWWTFIRFVLKHRLFASLSRVACISFFHIRAPCSHRCPRRSTTPVECVSLPPPPTTLIGSVSRPVSFHSSPLYSHPPVCHHPPRPLLVLFFYFRSRIYVELLRIRFEPQRKSSATHRRPSLLVVVSILVVSLLPSPLYTKPDHIDPLPPYFVRRIIVGRLRVLPVCVCAVRVSCLRVSVFVPVRRAKNNEER